MATNRCQNYRRGRPSVNLPSLIDLIVSGARPGPRICICPVVAATEREHEIVPLHLILSVEPDLAAVLIDPCCDRRARDRRCAVDGVKSIEGSENWGKRGLFVAAAFVGIVEAEQCGMSDVPVWKFPIA